MTSINIGGAEIQYQDKGNGPVVLFLHGFPLSLAMWDGQDALASRNRVVRFDARGFGQSAVGDSLLTMDRIADDAAVLIEKLRLGPVILAGCSMGGYAAFSFVRKHAALLRGLILVDTRAGADTQDARIARRELATRVAREGARVAMESFLPKTVGETTKKSRADVVARVKDMMLGTPPQGIVNALNGLAARADSTPTLREITVPTLIVCGDEDTLTPVAESEKMQREIQGSELVVIPKSGHLPSMETPAEFNATVSAFLDRF